MRFFFWFAFIFALVLISFLIFCFRGDSLYLLISMPKVMHVWIIVLSLVMLHFGNELHMITITNLLCFRLQLNFVVSFFEFWANMGFWARSEYTQSRVLFINNFKSSSSIELIRKHRQVLALTLAWINVVEWIRWAPWKKVQWKYALQLNKCIKMKRNGQRVTQNSYRKAE